MFGLTEERYNQMMNLYNNNEEVIKEIVDEWGSDKCNQGYDIFDYDGTGLLEIEAIMDVGAFDDESAVDRAVNRDGIKIIPVTELPINIPTDMKFYGWIDTEENRKKLEIFCNINREVCISVKLLYEKYGNDLSFCSIRVDEDYYDLVINEQVVCMDGEECIINKHTEKGYVLSNHNGEVTTTFFLTDEEFKIGVLQ